MGSILCSRYANKLAFERCYQQNEVPRFEMRKGLFSSAANAIRKASLFANKRSQSLLNERGATLLLSLTSMRKEGADKDL